MITVHIYPAHHNPGRYECKNNPLKNEEYTRFPGIYCSPLPSHYPYKGTACTFTTTAITPPSSTSYRHALQLVIELPPVISLQLRVFHSLLCPVLVPPADLILRVLEVRQFVTQTFLDEYATRMLRNNRLLVLLYVRLRDTHAHGFNIP
jgi:hypothetical protein